MTEVLEVVGLLALTGSGFVLGPAVGLAVLGVSCLWIAFQRSRKVAK